MADSTTKPKQPTELHPGTTLLKANAPLAYTTNLQIGDLSNTGNLLPYSYSSMPGNQPQAYANTVFLYQTSALSVPTGVKPLFTNSVQGNTQAGDGMFQPVSITNSSYLCAFAAGPDPKNIVALAFLPAVPPGTQPNPQTFQPSIIKTWAGSYSVSYQYSVPSGTRPQTDGDWIGLWIGYDESALYTTPPTAFVQASTDMPSNSGQMQGITIQRGMICTLGYFKGGYAATNPRQSTLACSYTWQN